MTTQSGVTDIDGLSPPWYTLQRKLAHTIGRDPAVTVSDINTSVSPYVITVVVDDWTGWMLAVNDWAGLVVHDWTGWTLGVNDWAGLVVDDWTGWTLGVNSCLLRG